ncbi:2-amino-4-hydroxy-6-hydroxymethyldihydropteridine diphosphokinase [Chenggangzhangella methanolivorans]|uniref:2-amino-4-hydroxy-6-hydroxymethyldihydropteridine pyrophosphokinase n=1 Tax=Chenggangzhangella methanolivorans TaxID=1437009 RepID=A0A9E6RFC8_9HYPH|nr:2-amino-4-hydroxy-6-hydroxymethyldihydropteridine diphosphokinase [Chenggangzhangella methanolivorans]QZN99931.1 2-amino-4-hydroxy-6-hydroxymethyldihydropteridine diphosphokinase [Chenggangzhangella methanolivorans]
MTEIGLGLGSNVGDKIENVRRALERLFAGPEFSFVAASSIWRTAPWGYLDQDWFANACAVGRTELSADEALAFTQSVEAELGRETTFRWGPRLIDIDILYLGETQVRSERLIIPHKEMFNRAFVLTPLAEVRPDLILDGRSIRDAAAVGGDQGFSRLAQPWRPDGTG